MSDQLPNDSMVDGVRQIRARISQKFGNDIDKLANHLRQVGREYAQRRGIYSKVTRKKAAQVEAGWGDMSARPVDRIVDEIRLIRTATAAPVRGVKKSRKKQWRS